MISTLKLDNNPIETKKPGNEGFLIFHGHNMLRVIVCDRFDEADLPECDEDDFNYEELLWLRRSDGMKFYELGTESLTRNNNKEVAFNHRWFKPIDDWDTEVNL